MPVLPAPAPPGQAPDPRAAAVADLPKLDSRRVGARVLDEFLILGVLVLVQVAFGPLHWPAPLLFLLFSTLYFFLCEAITGQTLGKSCLGLRVVRRDGGPPTVNAVAARNVFRIVEEPILALVVMVCSGRRRRQRLGDLLAGTTVAREAGTTGPARSPLLVGYPALWLVLALVFAAAVGPPRIHFGGPPQTPVGTPPTASLAGPMSFEWRSYARRVDSICESTWESARGSATGLAVQSQVGAWSNAQGNAASQELNARIQAEIHARASALGPAPEHPALFRRWLQLIADRGELYHLQSIGWASGRAHGAWRAQVRSNSMLIESNYLGQRFGLKICTASGPRYLPGSSSGKMDRYLQTVDLTCAGRSRREDRLMKRDALRPEQIVGMSIMETMGISIVVPHDEAQYTLRRRILQLKRSFDRDGRRMLAAGEDQWEQAAMRFNRHAVRLEREMRRLGLPHCADWGLETGRSPA